ncbi:MAG: valine--tRNA ligase, partial [Deltaproteobacteria bacterium]|nr:valine--tRNA ligase [Deltaproteobacteria bacterium]
TRPETMLGDTAVAVNPEDERYKGLIGMTVMLPLTGRLIPIIGDGSVSIEFGTGAVKITPAHDFNDFEVAKRHNLPALKVMDINADMNENAGRFMGQSRFDARKKVVSELEAEGLLERTEDYKLMLGSCYRCGTIVEPTLSRQWFVKVGPLAGPAIEAVEKNEIRFIPKNWERTYFEWMRNIRDWCISRQIWWGHRIPAWHCKDCNGVTVEMSDPSGCAACKGKNIEQDPDVLDTWFSSALWPFSTLGWPDETEDLLRYYPTSTLSTSFDIIFFWVARMIMMGLKFMDGKPPFRDVYIHALIRDAEGQKMSKSKGNVIDPLTMMDTYGTDALRFTLAALAAQGRDIKLAEERVSGYRNFCNKIWNLARFTLMNAGAGCKGAVVEPRLNTADRWILTRRDECVKEVSGAIDRYEFDFAARALYSFVWHEVCDWYVEIVKKDLRGDNGEERKGASSEVLVSLLKDALKMLHPFMPFITEEIYSYLPGARGYVLASSYPEAEEGYPEASLCMGRVMDVIRAIRNIRTDMNVPLDARVECICISKDGALREALTEGADAIKDLAKVRELTVKESGERPKDAATAIAGGFEGGPPAEVFVVFKELIDFEAETRKLQKELDKVLIEFAGVDKKLKNAEFVSKAPKEVVEKDMVRLAALKEKMAKLEAGIERMKGAKR